MLLLNLLPPAEKANLKQDEIQRWVGFYGSMILAVVFVFIFCLIVVWSYLLIQLNSVSANLKQAQSNFKDQGIKNEESNIKQINARLRVIDAAQRQQLYYSRALAALAALIPPGVSLKNISIDGSGRSSVSGFATDRSQVLAVKDGLAKSAYFKNIESPLSNIIEQKNINFVFSFDINTELLADSNE